MWWLAIPVAIGVGKFIYDSMSRNEREARERWEYKRIEVTKSVEEHRRQIEEHISEAKESYNFHFLTTMHHSSLIVANSAHKLLQDARMSLDGIGKMLVTAKEKRESLKKEIKICKVKVKEIELRNDVKLVSELRNSLFDDKDKVKEQRNNFSSEVKRLNAQTAGLKIFIRDRCGNKGMDWFNRLEERKRLKRISEGKPV